MRFIEFVFSFLYIRNWHTGERELSRPRVAIFSAALFLIVLGIALIALLQAPVSYISPEASQSPL